jgi:hypothetical protein
MLARARARRRGRGGRREAADAENAEHRATEVLALRLRRRSDDFAVAGALVLGPDRAELAEDLLLALIHLANR